MPVSISMQQWMLGSYVSRGDVYRVLRVMRGRLCGMLFPRRRSDLTPPG